MDRQGIMEMDWVANRGGFGFEVHGGVRGVELVGGVVSWCASWTGRGGGGEARGGARRRWRRNVDVFMDHW